MQEKQEQLAVIITGASSGIGRATALAFARIGAKVVVAARRKDLLDELVSEIENMGSEALAVAVDVTDERAVEKLAKDAFLRFGQIDVWVNNAGVIAFGEFCQIPSHVFRRVIEVNFFGCVNGMRAILPYFKDQNHGVVINVASMAGTVGQPYTTPYTASKFAIMGLSEAVNWELEDYNIHVCAVLPASIDTPLFQHGANFSGKEPKALTPTYDAQDVANKIVELSYKPESKVFVGTVAPILEMAHKFVPDTTAKNYAAMVRHNHFQNKTAQSCEGNLFEPMAEGNKISGGWKN